MDGYGRAVEGRPGRRASGGVAVVASKFSLFTATLVFWVVVTLLAYDLRQDKFDVGKGLLLCVMVMLVSGAISRFTIRLLARPLKLLQAGITSVRNGHLEPIQVSKTGDEIEFLGESFNGMIEALAASRKEMREQQEFSNRESRNGPINWKKPRGRRRRPIKPRASFWPTFRTSCGHP